MSGLVDADRRAGGEAEDEEAHRDAMIAMGRDLAAACQVARRGP